MSDSDDGMDEKSSNENHDFADFADFSGGTAPATATDQEKGLRGRQALDAHLATLEEQPSWKTIYDDLLAERVEGPDGKAIPRWDWRKALLIARRVAPKALRWPQTEAEFARLINIKSTRTIREWMRKDPEIEKRIAALPKQMLMEHVADVLDALVTVAKMPVWQAHPDRKMILEMTGQYSPKGNVALEGTLRQTTVMVYIPDNQREPAHG